MHAVGLRFIRSFEERILIMVALVNPGYAGTLGIRYIAGITIGVTNPPVKTRSGRLGGP